MSSAACGKIPLDITMEKADFSKYLSQIYGHGAVMTAMAMGHELGLFKLLCDADCPLSAADIADRTGLKERYTREWLSSMVAAGIIHQDRDTDLYIVPETHRQELKLRASSAPALFLLCDRRHDIKSCFSKDGPYGLGFPPAFFDWLDEYRRDTLDTEMIPNLLAHGIRTKLEAGIKVVDLGCGTGYLTIELAKRFPRTTFTGLEYSDKALATAREHATTDGINNVTFEFGDAHNLPDSLSGTFDLVIVYDVLHDLPDPPLALTQIHKIMKEDGYFSLIEADVHSNPCDNAGSAAAAMYYTFSTFMCLPSSMSDEKHVGYGPCWGREEIEKALHVAGFKIQGNAASIIVTGKQHFYLCSK